MQACQSQETQEKSSVIASDQIEKIFESSQEIEELNKLKLSDQSQDINSQMIQNQMDQIQQEVNEQDNFLISEIKDITELEKEYEKNLGFMQKIQCIKNQYPSFRRVRRDGSCFYRAFLYKLFEQVVLYGDEELQKKLEERVKQSKIDLENMGYQVVVFEEFQQLFLNKLSLIKSHTFSPEQLMSIFADQYTADALNLYLRMLTSMEIKKNVHLFENFVDFDIYGGVEEFCQFEVDPIDKDADQLQIIALTEFFQVRIKIIYLDANINTKMPTIFTKPEDSQQFDVILLYRPGHYDILYS